MAAELEMLSAAAPILVLAVTAVELRRIEQAFSHGM